MELLVKLELLNSVTLQLNGNKISTRGIEELSKEFFKMKKLETLKLNLERIQIDNTAISSLAKVFGNAHLKKLNIWLDCNNISIQSFQIIANSLGVNLEQLALGLNDSCLTDQHMIVIADKIALMNCLSLLEIDCSGTKITDMCTIELMKRIVACVNLTTLILHMGRNNISPMRKSYMILELKKKLPLTNIVINL